MTRRLAALLLLVLAACDRPTTRPRVAVAVAGQTDPLQRLAQEDAGIEAVIDTSNTLDGDVQVEVGRAHLLTSFPGVIGVVGHSSSRTTLATSPIYSAAGIPMVVPSATSRLLRTVPNAFVLAPDDSVEAAAIARFAADSLRARAVWVIYLNDPYGIGLRDGLRVGLAAHGVRTVTEIAYGERSDVELLFDAAATRGRPDAILIAGRVDDGLRVLRALAPRWPGVPVVFGDGAGADYAPMLTMAHPAFPVYIATFWWPRAGDARDAAFVTLWRQLTNNHPGPADALRRDGIHLVAAAIRDGARTGADVTRWLRRLGRDRPPFDGITGPIDFTGRRGRPVVILQPTPDSIRVVAR